MICRTGRRQVARLLAAVLLLAVAAKAEEATVLECTAAAYLSPKGDHLEAGHIGEGEVWYRLDTAKGRLDVEDPSISIALKGQVLRHGDETVFLSDPAAFGEVGLATVTFIHNTASGLFTAVIRFLTQPEIRALGEDAAWRDQFTAPLDHLFMDWGTCTGPAT